MRLPFQSMHRGVAIAATVALGCWSASAMANTVTVTNGWTSATKTYAPNIPSASGTTSFPSYSDASSWNYGLYPFTVSQSGDYVISVTTSPVINSSWLLEGTFAPTATFPPTTPLSAFKYGRRSPDSVPYTTDMPAIRLEAGQTYSLLIAFNIAGSPADTSTFSITGPGCIHVVGHGTPCGDMAAVPAISPPALVGASGMLAALGIFATRRRRSMRTGQGAGCCHRR